MRPTWHSVQMPPPTHHPMPARTQTHRHSRGQHMEIHSAAIIQSENANSRCLCCKSAKFKSTQYHCPSEASLTVKAIPYSAHGRRFESQLAGDFHLERGVRLSGTPPAVETVGGIYTPRVGQLQRGCPWLLVGDLFNSTLLYFTLAAKSDNEVHQHPMQHY
jgi:hypothetical protein